ncbi:MAG: alpha/beta hydrolase [bacterium]|nr:alpha/beta hydrolase [bacterium]
MFDEFIHKTLNIPYRLTFERLRKAENPHATVIFIHGIASSAQMWHQAEHEIAGEFDIFAIDLLGHGKSPKPKWVDSQKLETQARALRRSVLFFRKMGKPLFLVGHSMGALVASEYAQKYPQTVDGIFLLSPPIYSPEEAEDSVQEAILKKGYNQIIEGKEKEVIEALNTAIDMKIADVSRFESEERFRSVRRSLKEAIIRQNTFEVLSKIDTRTHIVYGAFDPVVIGKNIRKLARNNPNISSARVLAAHDPTKTMLEQVSKGINKILKEQNE